MKSSVAAILILASTSLAVAQTSSSYRLSEFTFNLGGRPEAGITATSASFAVTLDAIGEPFAAAGLSSASFHLDGTLLGAFPPPGEVLNLILDTPTHLRWDAQSAAGTYNLYRGTVQTLPGGYGSCFASGIEPAEAADGAAPAIGTTFFYVVTVSNRLGEEGTMGFKSTGAERPDLFPCP